MPAWALEHLGLVWVLFEEGPIAWSCTPARDCDLKTLASTWSHSPQLRVLALLEKLPVCFFLKRLELLLWSLLV